ncbi:MAG: hypothetical protein M1840_000622 [Geoglossum simile]|nr:MAG: hypothetical protein M1840_000622 [Geoglossum simile]
MSKHTSTQISRLFGPGNPYRAFSQHWFEMYDVITMENTASSSKGGYAPPATGCIILEVENFGDNPGTNQQLSKPQTKSGDVCMGWWRLWVWSFFNGHRLPPSSRTVAKYSREVHIIGVHAVDAMKMTAQLPTNDNERIVAIFPVNDYLWEILVSCDFLAEFTEHVTSLGHHIEQDYYPGKPSRADVNKFSFSSAIDSSIKQFAMRVALARKVGSGLDPNRSKVVSTYLN